MRWWTGRDETANWIFKVPRGGNSQALKWVERAESLLATGASSSAVAVQMGYGSANAFSKLFKQRTGQLPPDTRMEGRVRSTTRRRVDHARELLIARNHSVGQVVKLAGFNNRQGLDKAFKRAFGMPPAAWIKWYRRGVEVTVATVTDG